MISTHFKAIKTMFHFHLKSFINSLLLFLVLVIIALFVRDSFIRPFVGDVLVVIWLFYCFKSVLNLSTRFLAIMTLILAYCVEFAQYFRIIDWLGLGHHQLIRVVFGATFDWLDLLAYTLGFIVIMVMASQPPSIKK